MEWEGIRHPFRPDRVWSTRLLWPMYPLCMLSMTCWTCKTKIKSHKFIYEWILFLVLKKFRSVLVIKKKFDFGLLKIPDLFCNNKKRVVLSAKKKKKKKKIQICVYYIKQSLLIQKKKIRYVFKNLEKCFLIYKRLDLFFKNQKKWFFLW